MLIVYSRMTRVADLCRGSLDDLNAIPRLGTSGPDFHLATDRLQTDGHGKSDACDQLKQWEPNVATCRQSAFPRVPTEPRESEYTLESLEDCSSLLFPSTSLPHHQSPRSAEPTLQT